MLLSVIIPVHNKLKFTANCLYELNEQIKNLNTKEVSVVVVDDGSTDGTSDWIKTKFPDVIVLKGNGDLWWSGAVNLGAKYAINTLNTQFLLLWNNDISFRDDYFLNLIEILTKEKHRNTIIGSKILVKEDPALTWSMGGYFNPYNGRYAMHGYFKPDGPEYSTPLEVDWLTGMGTVIPSEIALANNFWKEKEFPQYHGDSDFTYRAKLKGSKVIVHPGLILYNQVSSSGIEHSGKWKLLVRLLTDIRSKSNFRQNFRFYKLYAKSPLAYLTLFSLYFKIIGGFIKWKLLNLAGIRKKVYEA